MAAARPRTIDCIVGARPNFVKIAPIMRAIRACGGLAARLIHTGQHYDVAMNAVFFEELGIPNPDINLEVGSGSGTEQTAQVMLKLEPVLVAQRPDLLLVVGDVNSTVASALVAAKLGIPLAHVEAGLRSNDRTMPEEINRLVTDRLSDLLFTTERAAIDNLLNGRRFAGSRHLRRQRHDRHVARLSRKSRAGENNARGNRRDAGYCRGRAEKRFRLRHVASSLQRRRPHETRWSAEGARHDRGAPPAGFSATSAHEGGDRKRRSRSTVRTTPRSSSRRR